MSNLFNVHRLFALAKPVLTPSGSCWARDPLFKPGACGLTNIEGDTSPGEEDTSVFELRCRLGGVMDGTRNELGEDELMMMGLTAAMLELSKSLHRCVEASTRSNVKMTNLHEQNQCEKYMSCKVLEVDETDMVWFRFPHVSVLKSRVGNASA